MNIPFTLGVNYWPRRKAMYWWSEFDKSEVDDEFALIESLGLNVVRIFLLWDDFQPTPDRVEHLDELRQVADVAEAHHLKLDVTFFTGHMSGPNWAPRWLMGGDIAPRFRQLVSGGQVVTGGYRNPYTDPIALDAERLLLRTVVRELKDHPAIWMWNLGNEPDLFAHPPTDAVGQAWVREMTELIHEIDDQHPVTCGLHGDSLFQNNGLRIDQVYAETDVAVMHSYPMYTNFVRHPLDPDYVPFTCALTAALSGKRVLMEEFGGCTAPPGTASHVMEWDLLGAPRKQFMASEEDLAKFIQESLPRLVEVGTTGALIWCFADYATELWDRPPCGEFRHERHFGLVRPDGSLKPHAQALQAFAATHPTVRETIPDWAHFDLSADAFYSESPDRVAKRYRQYLERLAIKQ
ncbi:MAG: glycoside hydrolase 5 family protein [Aggregatilineales bacterium]